VTSLHSGSLCLSCVCPKVPPASGIEPHVSQRKPPIGVRGCASLVGRLRGCDTAQVQRRHVVNDRQLMVRRSTPLHKSVAQVGQVAVSDAETFQSAAAGLPLIACQSTWNLGKIWQGLGQAVCRLCKTSQASASLRTSRTPRAS
jgi:hypothetical protein